MSIQTVNPFTNKVVKTFDEMSDVTLNNLVEQAAKAFEKWKKQLTNIEPKY